MPCTAQHRQHQLTGVLHSRHYSRWHGGTGRTYFCPFYNSDQGKDDIGETSMVIMNTSIAGNRVVQATDDAYVVHALNPSTQQMDDGGEILEPKHIHKELRQLLGINLSLVDQYPLDGADFNLLGL